MKLIFDFDDVIFNAQAFKTFLFKRLSEEGISHVGEYYKTLRKHPIPFSLRSFLNILILDDKDKREKMYQEIMEQCPLFINDKVVSVMKKYGKENCYIVTHGDKNFQMDKIHRSIGEDMVREVVVVPEGKGDAVREIALRHQNEEVIFVDDRLQFINDLPFGSGDIDNLKTILFNEHGVTNLEAEIEESLKEEKKKSEMEERNRAQRGDDHSSSAGPGMMGRLH